MTESDHANPPKVEIASMRNAGSDQVDPVRFRYIESLATRTLAHQGEVRRILEAKVAEALQAYGRRVERKQAGNVSAEWTTPRTPLADLVRDLTPHDPKDVGGMTGELDNARLELRAISQFRKTWSQLSVDRQVKQALRQGPANAGPLNSHWLILRSIDLMRKSSPDYLNRFMSYVDTLLLLDQADKKGRPATAAAKKLKRK